MRVNVYHRNTIAGTRFFRSLNPCLSLSWFFLILLILLFSDPVTAQNFINLERLTFSANGRLYVKSPDLINGDTVPYNTGGYENFGFAYQLAPGLKAGARLYIEESSYCLPYYRGHGIWGFLSGTYEGILFEILKVKLSVGDLGRITFNNGLTYKEFESRGFFMELGYGEFQFRHYHLGIGYISSTDVLSESFSWKDSVGLSLIWSPTEDGTLYERSECYGTVYLRLRPLQWLNFYTEFGKEFISGDLSGFPRNTWESGWAGLVGLEIPLTNKLLKLKVSLEARTYDGAFNSFTTRRYDNENYSLDSIETSLVNWKDFFTFSGDVWGLYFRIMNDLRIIGSLFWVVDIEFLKIGSKSNIWDIPVYESGFAYNFTESTRGFVGVCNRDQRNFNLYTFRIFYEPVIEAYFKFSF